MIRKLLPAFVIFSFVLNACGAKVDLVHTGLVKVSEHVYAFISSGPSVNEGLGANSGFVVGDKGVLVVDSRYNPDLARELLAAVRSVTSAPVLYLVNTHYHTDHTWGNSVFKDEGAVIIAHPDMRRDLKKYSPVYMEYYREYNPDAYERLKDVRVVLPDTTFTDELRLDLGGVEVVLNHFGPAHTAGDCIVTVPEEHVALTGGIVSSGYHPNMGDQGMDFDNWVEIIDRLDGMGLHYIIPGQGKVCRAAQALKLQKDYILTLRKLCIEEIKNLESVENAVFSITVPGTEDYKQANILPYNIQAVYCRELPNVLKPAFELNLPKGFTIADGGGGTGKGWIRWSFQSEKGYFEFEVHWQPSDRREIIIQDIHDMVARYQKRSESYKMQIEGSKKVDLGGEEALADFGTWELKKKGFRVSGGIWTWLMALRDNRLYSIQLSMNAGGDKQGEKKGMEELEKVASTFRVKAD